ncbi:hypothetical protein HanRHA438_Chr14g0672281 [Helianthus annuus]|uniref:Uncharacterized protein n=1 Tax=Helianthus annuus TaxID=4232 RepID=A0A9K3EBT6_HELAN|nr:hypothetical protein HanXRQr2_Chr14g0661171 [Helianthus annuus]KAJ0841791.1 hypothetical protein HanPSC8_Chr14g0634371 [Helianthus annuus]KAJ0855342.1 hypothetical protein HanRHA438_Chr14g0672281 [Helianthus annuus]
MRLDIRGTCSAAAARCRYMMSGKSVHTRAEYEGCHLRGILKDKLYIYKSKKKTLVRSEFMG